MTLGERIKLRGVLSETYQVFLLGKNRLFFPVSFFIGKNRHFFLANKKGGKDFSLPHIATLLRLIATCCNLIAIRIEPP